MGWWKCCAKHSAWVPGEHPMNVTGDDDDGGGGKETYSLMKVCVCIYMCVYTYIFWLHLQHVKIPGLGIESEPQLRSTPQLVALPDP